MSDEPPGASPVDAVVGPPPAVPEWMTGAGEPVHQASLRLVVFGQAVRQLADAVATRLKDGGEALGWQGRAADATAARAAVDGARMTQAAEVLERAGAALRVFTEALGLHGNAIRGLLAERSSLHGSYGVVIAPSMPDVATFVRAQELDELLRAQMSALVTAEAAAASALRPVAGTLDELARAAAEESWVGDLAPPSLAAVLQRAGVLPDAAEQRLLEVMLLAPDGQPGTNRLRRELLTWPPGRIAELLLRHPELAERLNATVLPIGDWAPDEVTRQLFATAMPAGDVPAQDRIENVRRFFASLDADDAARLAMLWPTVVGNLDGAPIAARVQANRVNIAAALNAEQRNHLVAKEAAQWAEIDPIDHVLEQKEAALARSVTRQQLYEKLLYEVIENPTPLTGRAATVGHQVLVFDPTDDGRIAELWGDIDEKTEHVGIFVPGTGSDLTGFQLNSGRAKALAESDTTNRTAVVAWLGADMPDSIPRDAPSPSYSQDGAPALRDFFNGLDVPAAADTTVVGHSYGGAMVGLAEAAGMHPTRIVMVEGAGTGFGVDDLTAEDIRNTDHYTMTAPGDDIEISQKASPFVRFLGIGHGADPDTTKGFTRLETGRFDDAGTSGGPMIQGQKSHGWVLTKGSTSFHNISQVIQGGRVTGYTPPEKVRALSDVGSVTRTVHAYENPHFQGPQVDIP